MMDQFEREMAEAFDKMKIRTRIRSTKNGQDILDRTNEFRKEADRIIGDYKVAYGFEAFDENSAEYKRVKNLMNWMHLSLSGCLESAKNILRYVCFDRTSTTYEEIAISEDQCMFVSTDDGTIYYVERVKG